MAYETIVAQKVLGCYYTPDIKYPGSDQPVWATINSGLPATDIRQLQGRIARHYCLLETDRDVYRRVTDQDWTKVLDNSAALTACDAVYQLVRPGYSLGSGNIVWIYAEKGNNLHLWAAFQGQDAVDWWHQAFFVMDSTDAGDNWNTPNFLARYDFGAMHSFAVENGYGIYTFNISGTTYVAISDNGFLTLVGTAAPLGYGGDNAHGYVSYCDNAYRYVNTAQAGIGTEDLDQLLYDDPINETILQDSLDIGPKRPDAMWHSLIDWRHQRILKNNKLWVTGDAWATVIDETPATLTPDVSCMGVPIQGNVPLLFGRYSPTGPSPTTVLMLETEYDTTLIDKSGTSPDDIPYTAGGIAYCGIICEVIPEGLAYVSNVRLGGAESGNGFVSCARLQAAEGAGGHLNGVRTTDG